MKDRILTGWTVVRGFYVLMGAFLIAQSVIEKQWFGALFGAYFASMGIFRFGCAAGNCYTGNYKSTTETNTNATIDNVEFEEVK